MAFTGVVIDYGHGGRDPQTGAYLTPTAKQYQFTDVNPPLWIGEGITNRMQAALLIGRLLDAGVTVWDCVGQRQWTEAPASWEALEQQDVPLSTRVSYANQHSDALFLSLHSNAIGNSLEGPSQNARGFCIFTSPGQTKSDEVATSINTAFIAAFASEPVSVRYGDTSDGDPDHEESFYVLRKTAGSAVLGEALFFTNYDDALYLLSNHGQQVIAGAYFDGIAPFLGTSVA